MKLVDCEEYLDKNIESGRQPVGVEFTDVIDIQLPCRLGHGNIAWPVGWTQPEATYWRAMMELPGSFMSEWASVEVPDWYDDYLKGKRKETKRQIFRQHLRWLFLMD